jgi:elongin-A
VEAKRLEEAGNKIRSQRLEAEELKRKRQVQLTDRLLPQKRFRGGCKFAWFPFLSANPLILPNPLRS